jgi:hypothetical protein
VKNRNCRSDCRDRKIAFADNAGAGDGGVGRANRSLFRPVETGSPSQAVGVVSRFLAP